MKKFQFILLSVFVINIVISNRDSIKVTEFNYLKFSDTNINDSICDFDTANIKIPDINKQTEILKHPNLFANITDKNGAKFERNVNIFANDLKFKTDSLGIFIGNINAGDNSLLIKYYKNEKKEEKDRPQYELIFEKNIHRDSIYNMKILLAGKRKMKNEISVKDIETPYKKQALNVNTIKTYNEFLKRFPSGKFRKLIYKKRQIIIDSIREKVFFEYIKKWYKLNCCIEYQNIFPKGKHYSEVIDVKNEILKFKKVKIKKTIETCNEYLLNYPNGHFKKNVDELKETYYYLNAKKTLSIENCEHYLAEYPSGKYYKIITNLKNDILAFQKAKNISTISSYQEYINSFDTGVYVAEATNAIEELTIYEKVVLINTIKVYEEYIALYKNGIRLAEAKNSIKDHKAFQTASLIFTTEGYKNYIDSFPLGLNKKYAEQRIEKLKHQNILIDRRDGKIYKTVEINGLLWMSENLNYDTIGAWQYDDIVENGDIYGRLYSWECAKKICPQDWQLPSDSIFKEMLNSLGGDKVAGGKIKSTSELWKPPNKEATNESGFNALPAGNRLYLNNLSGSYSYLKQNADFWTSTECDGKETAWKYSFLNKQCGSYRFSEPKTSALSVRCFKETNK